jgi:hypothetical protein
MSRVSPSTETATYGVSSHLTSSQMDVATTLMRHSPRETAAGESLVKKKPKSYATTIFGSRTTTKPSLQSHPQLSDLRSTI